MTRGRPVAALGLLLISLAGSSARGATATPQAISVTTPDIFVARYSAQAVVPTTAATVTVDDSYAWTHGFFNKVNGAPINASAYSEIADPGFVAGAVLFSSSSNPTPLANPNNFPGYAFASYPQPANQTDIEKCVSPTVMVAAPCTAASPDQAIAIIDPAKPSARSYVSATGPLGGEGTGHFASSSDQALSRDGFLNVTASAAGQDISFAGGLLKLSNFRSVATASANGTGGVSGHASCTVGDVSVMGQSVSIGPGGQVDTEQLAVLLTQLNAATGKQFTITAPTKGKVVKGDHSVQAGCQGPAVNIENPLPGPLSTLHVGQEFILGVIDVAAGASLDVAQAPLAPTPGPTGPVSSVGSVDAVPGTPGTPGTPPVVGSPAPSVTAAPPPPAATVDNSGTPAATSPVTYRRIVKHPRSWLLFTLTFLTGALVIGTAGGLIEALRRLAARWRDTVAPIG